jgi:disulfide bond formation protein DsbB
MSIKNSLLISLIAAAFALIFAYISQYVFGYQPCILCIYQRIPFFVIIGLSAISLISKKFTKLVFFCCLFLFSINAAIAIYHVGVEQKIFAGPSTCSSPNLNDFDDLEALKEAILSTKAVRCDEPQFFFLKLSMAAWNVIYCGFLALYLLFNIKPRTKRLGAISQK